MAGVRYDDGYYEEKDCPGCNAYDCEGCEPWAMVMNLRAQLERAVEVVKRSNYKNYGDSPYAKQLLSNDRIYIKEGK